MRVRIQRLANWKTSFSALFVLLALRLSFCPSRCFMLVASTHERFMSEVKDTRLSVASFIPK